MRKEPYTVTGIRRVSCFRCGAMPGHSQWQVCADGNVFRVVCQKCDVELNRRVLKWMRDPNAEEKLRNYEGASV